MYCTPIWKIRKVVYKAQIADTVINKQATELRQLTWALKASDSSAAAAREAKNLAIKAGVELENQVKLTEQKSNYWEQLSKKWKAASIAGACIIILELITILVVAL